MPAEGSNIRPEPRDLPERHAKPRIEPRRSTDDPAMRREMVSVRKQKPHGKAAASDSFRVIPFLLFAAIAGMSASVVYSLFYFFHPSGPARMEQEANQAPTPKSGKAGTLQPAGGGSAGSSPATAAATKPDSSGDSGDRERLVTAEDAIAAQEVLESFLKAPGLDARLDLITPPMPRAALEGTILGGPLPEAVRIHPNPARHDRVERLTEFPFEVSFVGSEGGSDEFTILVKKRGDQPPQVAVEPFLDLVGGRLAAFAAAPAGKMETFHAVIEAIPRCFDRQVPNAEKKFTYKLSSSEQGGEITRAYASLNSELAKELEQSTSALRWGIPMRATLVLSWNHKEDPGHPFLEVVKIQSLHWNS